MSENYHPGLGEPGGRSRPAAPVTDNYMFLQGNLRSVIREDCPCPKTDCARHKSCLECRAYHAGRKKLKLAYCDRPQPKNGLVRAIKKIFRLP